MPPAELLPELAEIVLQAGKIAQEKRLELKTQLKPDGSILTNADQAVEEFLRERLTHLIPGSTVWGEEFGHENEGAGGQWLVDPVDGTSNFSFGSPLWGVSVGLMSDAQIDLGAVFLPDLDELYLSARGGGVTCNGKPLPPIPPGPVQRHELVSYNDQVLSKYSDLPGKMRHAGAFVIDGCFVAQQRYRGLIGIRERLYDIAACVLFGLELGADVRYADGTPIDFVALQANVKIRQPWIIFPKESGLFL